MLCRNKTMTIVALCLSSISSCSGGGDGDSSSEPGPINTPPVVSAGADQSVAEGSQVTLNGNVSDREGSVSFEWQQISGPTIELSQATQLNPTFAAPFVLGESRLVFRLTADDSVNSPVSDDVTVSIIDGNVTIKKINPDGQSYIDPEIHPLRNEIVFQTSGEVWVGAFDPETGEFDSETGKDAYIDNTINLQISANGPEYGVDAMGVSIFYNVEASDGSAQFSRATELGMDNYAVERLTPNGLQRWNQLPSINSASFTTYLIYARQDSNNGSQVPPGFISYLDEATPDIDRDATQLRPGFANFRWLRNSSMFTTTIAEDGPDLGQIVLIDAALGTRRVVTNDEGVKFDPYAWFAPEFDGAIAIQATVNDTDIAVYVDRGGTFFERVSLLTPPDETDLQFVQSAEPFVSEDGVSYISLTLKDDPGSVFRDVSESEIWIYGISEEDRFVLNCGDGEPGKVRHEAEMVSGTHQVLVYYNELLSSGVFDLVVCQSGLAP